MIDGVRGRLLRRGTTDAVVEVGGVALSLALPQSTAEHLATEELGSEVRLPTHLNVREDALELFGFTDEEQRALFRALLAVSGIGPRLALSIVGTIRSADFARAIALGDAAVLRAAPGVGRKLADRLLVELRDRIQAAAPRVGVPKGASAPGDPWEDAGLALAALGYDRLKVSRVLGSLRESLGDDVEPDALVRAALGAMKV